MNIVATFEIPFIQFLDEAAQPTAPLPDFTEDAALMVSLYKMMLKTRLFDDKAIKLQRTGKMGTYPSTLGQEAVAVGYGSVMHNDDIMVPYYRDYGAQLMRGVTMAEIFTYWGGDERGNDFSQARLDFPFSVPIGSQPLHAIGIAKAFQYRQQARAVITTLGDGATSEGDFYEAINAAGVWKLPVVFVVINNQWAISVGRDTQTATQTIAQKAIAAGISGLQVDGNDLIAIRDTVEKALARARQGEGPTLIEAITYRLCDHTTADDASRYRSKTELEQAWKKEPLIRLRQWLIARQWWDQLQEDQWVQECRQIIEQAVQDYLNQPRDEPTAMFDHLYANLPRALVEQRAEASHWAEKKGGAHD